jgi:hypothetical protein
VLSAAALATTCLVAFEVGASASPPVTVSALAPHQLAAGATRTVTVSGSGFRPGAVVEVSGGGVSSAHTTVASPTRLTTSLTAAGGAALGRRSLRVTVGDHAATLAHALVLAPPPTLTGVRPGSVAQSGRLRRLTLTGTHFEHGLAVTIGATRPRQVLVRSSSLAIVLARFPRTGGLGATTVTATNPDGGVGSDPAAVVVDAAPSITGLTTSVLNEDETTTEVLTGTGFQPGATLNLGPDVSATVTSVTPTTLVATLHATARATVGERTVTLTNPDLGTVARRDALRIDHAPTFTRWAVGDGAVQWTTTLRRPLLADLPTLAFSGSGVTVASESINGAGLMVVQFTISATSAATWRTMTITDGLSRWVVPRALKVRLPPTITHFPSLRQNTSFKTVAVRGANFEVCANRDPVVTVSGSGVSVYLATPAFGDLMYVSVSVDPAAAVGPRDVTMTNCDSGGTATSVGVLTVTAG